MTLATNPRSGLPKVARDASESEYLSAVHRLEPWRAATMSVCHLEGLKPLGELEHLSVDSTFAVIGVPPDHVVKFYGHWRSGSQKYETEVATLSRLGRDPSLPVPRLVAHGRLDEDWRYVVMTSVWGVRLSDAETLLEADELQRIASWMGGLARRLHAIPLSQEEVHDGAIAFRTLVEDRLARLLERPTLLEALPRHLHQDLARWMPSAKELLSSTVRAVLLHGAPRQEHVLGHYREGRFFPTGIIDVNSALIGDPLYDLGYMWWCGFRGDRALLRAYLEEADLADVSDGNFPRRALAWALVNACSGAPRLLHLENVPNLDELAERAFGGAGTREW